MIIFIGATFNSVHAILTQYTRSIKSSEKIIHAGLAIGRLKKKPEKTLALHVKS